MSAFRAPFLISTALATSIALPALALADDASADLGEITVSASASPVAVSETGASVTVITEDDLQQGGNLTLAEQLARDPGLSFTRSGGIGQTGSLRIRGLGGAYIGARIDGIDVTDPTGVTVAYDFGGATTAGLSRVEVLRGSQSALYGSSAVAGVVDMTTWRPTHDGASGAIALEGGSDATWSATGAAGVKGDKGEISFTLNRTISDGISAVKAGTEDDGFQSNQASVYGRYDITPGLSVGANGIWRQSKTDIDGYDASYALADTDDRADATLRGGRVFADFALGATTNEIAFARSKTERTYVYPTYGYSDDYRGARNALTYTGHWNATPTAAFNWGAGTEKETAEGYDSAKTNSVFGEALLTPLDGLDLSLAARNDVHSMFGSKPSGRAALAWRAAPDWTVRAVASTGFRAPSLYQLYSSYGDPDLKAETSKTFELGLERAFTGGSVQATLFQTTIKDRIGWDYAATSCGSAYGCYNQIDGDSTVKGVELTANYDLTPDWTLTGNYTYSDAKDDDAGAKTRMALAPRHTVNAGIEGQVAPNWHVGGSVQYVGDVVDSTGGMPDYTLVNVSAAYDVNPTTQAYIRIENLFDEDYETVRYYGEPGRQFFAGVRARF